MRPCASTLILLLGSIPTLLASNTAKNTSEVLHTTVSDNFGGSNIFKVTSTIHDANKFGNITSKITDRNNSNHYYDVTTKSPDSNRNISSVSNSKNGNKISVSVSKSTIEGNNSSNYDYNTTRSSDKNRGVNSTISHSSNNYTFGSFNSSKNDSSINSIHDHTKSNEMNNIDYIMSGENCPKQCSCHYSNERLGFIVDCANRGLTAVPEVIPKGTIYVNMRQNSIQELSDVSFKNWYTKSIQKLNLAQNNISSIEKNVFQYFNHLWDVNLSRNNISNINHLKLPVIHELNLQNNPLNMNDKFEENGYKKYEVVEIGYCETIYKRVTTSSNATFVKLFENVDMIMSTSKCTGPLTQDGNLPSVLNPGDRSETEKIVNSVNSNNFPQPTIGEEIFYCSLLVTFVLLSLFLISQYYNHAWTRYFRNHSIKRRPNTSVTIHVNPQSNSRRASPYILQKNSVCGT